MSAEIRKQRLSRLNLVFVRSPIYFVTACTQNCRNILATPAIHETFLRFGQEGPSHGAWIGAYVLMPDHLHLFVATDDEQIAISAWMKSLKNTISKMLRENGVAPPHWQKHSSITCFGVVSHIQKSGTMFAKTQCGRASFQRLRIGRMWERFSH